ncbi:[protein-PII] uridylyltransferase [Stratiformator vulcanicus]|uniref:Bifunctional uridylyltransferase/uridylyl-removing enzyme n=1 Tax=Stratiformator vulcanicus TaxID=2527980 RepID=A0A517R5Z5_9PLAN|nr:[protein-PII] uridylyltransferase [Stratiformator vulcanicus]QDT39324.1 Bifunctional uridylyltransferase/uridylyl-removing enzyme [Stratiformator vulcanicus]
MAADGTIPTQPVPLDERIRREVASLREGKAGGIHLAHRIATIFEEQIRSVIRDVLVNLPGDLRKNVSANTAVVLVGGSGRGELVPYSDCDLLILHAPNISSDVEAIVAEFIRKAWDSGLKIGHSVRTVDETWRIARQDIQIATSLVEARLLVGSTVLYDRMRMLFRERVVQHRLGAFLSECTEARQTERDNYGGSPNLLEPNVKRSPGGLRDVHWMRWIAYAIYGSSDVSRLRPAGGLNADDQRILIDGLDYLLKVRVELHLHAQREQDVLSRSEQIRIAVKWGFEHRPGQRDVEQFMQEYFRHATAICDIADRFAERLRPRHAISRIKNALLTRRVGGVFLLSPTTIDVLPNATERITASPERVIELFLFVARDGVDLTPRLEEAITRATGRFPNELTHETCRLFLLVLDTPDHVGKALRIMLRTGVLAYLIPEFTHARCLIQFSEYHSFTVDEHTFRTIDAANDFLIEPGAVGDARRKLAHSWMLNFALLLHDIGKGFDEDHSLVGRRIAIRTAARFRLSEEEQEQLTLLVYRHLLMVHLAFRRDTTEAKLLYDFTHEVGTPDSLRHLFVLSACDLRGVGPGIWTDWKADLLSEFYRQSMSVLGGDVPQSNAAQMDEKRGRIRAILTEADRPVSTIDIKDWATAELDGLSTHFLANIPEDAVAEDLLTLLDLGEQEVSVTGTYDEATATTTYRVIVRPPFTNGCFSVATGVLAAKRMQTVEAIIETTVAGIAIDRFRVIDEDFEEEVPDWRINDVAASLRAAIKGQISVARLFHHHRRYGDQVDYPPLAAGTVRVVRDVDTSEKSTIIDVFAPNRRGLLYTIATALLEMEVSIDLAKISTHVDQIVDVFYVTEMSGEKITDEARLDHIVRTVRNAVEEYLTNGYRRLLNTG